MPRYAIRPRAISGWYDELPMIPSITVYDTDARPTGLLDRDGNEVVALPDPVGFVELRERGK